MYIRKSVLTGAVTAAGCMVLGLLMFLFSFTELHIPTAVFAGAWGICLFLMNRAVSAISGR